MRTTRPARTWSIDERGFRVGDARVDLDASIHRAGMHDDLAGPDPLRRDPVERRVLAERRNERLAGRHPLLLQAQHVHDVRLGRGPRCRSRPRTRAPRSQRGRSVGGPISVERAPTSSSAWTSERATREWSTSPTIATCNPSRRPSASSIAYRSRSACVGCWCFPSPALTTLASVSASDERGRADRRVPDDDDVGVVGGRASPPCP